jgi:multiple sugar transport system permease protein
MGLLLLAPAALLLLLLFLAPVAYAFYLGLTNVTLAGIHAQHYWFTGAANLRRLWDDTSFWHSL